MTHIYLNDDIGTAILDIKKSELNGLIAKSIKSGAKAIEVNVVSKHARVIHTSVYYPKAGVRETTTQSY